MLDKKQRMNYLLDFYENLLTDKQQKIMDYYYKEDLSLNEIAEIQGISKAAVHDLIHRCNLILEDYESKLKLAEKYELRQGLYQQLLNINDSTVHLLVNQCIETE
ncbi:MAG: YlxM family DNA-binding protein [Erysipelotrichaceae bacterium]